MIFPSLWVSRLTKTRAQDVALASLAVVVSWSALLAGVLAHRSEIAAGEALRTAVEASEFAEQLDARAELLSRGHLGALADWGRAAEGAGAVATPLARTYERIAGEFGERLDRAPPRLLADGEQGAFAALVTSFTALRRLDLELLRALSGAGAAMGRAEFERRQAAMLEAHTAIEQAIAALRASTDSHRTALHDAQAARASRTPWRMALAALLAAFATAGLALAWLAARRSRARLVERVAELDRVDPLTRVANRNAWFERLTQELEQSRRIGYPVSIALLDFDRLERFNAERGFPAGDRLLEASAHAWRVALRKADVLARYNGGTFAVVLPGCTAEQAVETLARLRPLTGERQTFAAGVACWHWRETQTALIERCDVALRLAKADGGNRTTLSAAPPPNVDRPAHRRLPEPAPAAA